MGKSNARFKLSGLGKGLCRTLMGSALMVGAVAASAAGFSPSSTCSYVAVQACALPFPSDLFRNTVGKYNYSDNILDRNVEGTIHSLFPVKSQFPANFLPSKVINPSGGFSALGPVLFELTNWPLQTIPADGAGHLIVLDMESDEQVPMVVSLSHVANPQADFRERRPVIIGWPRARFEFGHKYVAVLLKAPFDAAVGNATTFTPSVGMKKVLENKAGFLVQNAYKNALEVVDRNNIARTDILAMTWFTVRSEAEVTTPMKTMVQTALSYPSIVSNLKVRDSLGDATHGLVTLSGNLSLVNFRASDGGVYTPYQPILDPELNRTDFVLTLPKWDQNTAVPISIWGHGLGNFKELTKSGYVMGDRLGMATVAIDHPNHGARIKTLGNKEPSIVVAVQSPMTIMHLLGMFVQAVVDHSVVAQHAQQALPQAVSQWRDSKYPNVPRLDGSRVIFDGMSLGAMLGTAIGAVAPELKGTYLVNGAGSLMHIFSESTFWDDMTSHVVPQNANGAELTFVLAMMQHYVDIADGNNFIQYFRNPPAGQDVRPLGMHYSIGDGSMPNAATRASAEIADLPLLKEVIEPEPNLRDGVTGREGFEDGFGLVQSGYGLELADQVKEQLKAFDADLVAGLDESGLLEKLTGIDLGNGVIGDLAGDILGTLNPGGGDVDSLSDLVDLIYEGDVEDFLTHFNRGTVEAVQQSIDWRCGVLQLPGDRCEMAKAKAVEDHEKYAEGGSGNIPNIPGGDGKDPIDQIDDIINDNLDRVQVTEGSAGSFEWFMLALLALWLVQRRRTAAVARHP